MRATIVDKFGHVCAVTFSGSENHAQWPESCPISLQIPTLRIDLQLVRYLVDCNIVLSGKPGQFLWGFNQSNPVMTLVVYEEPTEKSSKANYPAHDDFQN